MKALELAGLEEEIEQTTMGNDQQQEPEPEPEQEQEPQEPQQEDAAASAPPASHTTAFDPQRWTDLETQHLIDAYRDKWYQLKRGQLKARHWEEVANNVFLRCGGTQPSKSSVQCRHKMEKLRKKYREEKQHEERKGRGFSQWPFFERMDAMERGSQSSHSHINGTSLHIKKQPRSSSGAKPYSFTPLQESKPYSSLSRLYSRSTAQDAKPFGRPSVDDQDPQEGESSMSLRDELHNISPPRYQAAKGSFPSHNEFGIPFAVPTRRHRSSTFKDYGSFRLDTNSIPSMEERPIFKEAQAPIAELASVVRSLGEGFLRIERMKLEMQKDNERFRAEMELKRTGMLLESQKHIAEMISRALSRKKAIKKRHIEDI